MIVGIRTFRAGETLRKRVGEGDDRLLSYLAGFNPTTGAAVPDDLPTLISTTALGGAVRTCNLQLAGDLVNLADHGFLAGDRVVFGSTVGNVTAGQTYYVQSVFNSAAFYISETSGGAALDLTTSGASTVWGEMPPQVPVIYRSQNGSWMIARDHRNRLWRCNLSTGVWSQGYHMPSESYDVPDNSVPIKVGPLVVFPTQGADATLLAWEPEHAYYANPDVALRSTRPLSLKSPLDYDDDTAPQVCGFGLSSRQTCTMNTGANSVTATAHKLSVGQRVAFERTTGGVSITVVYHVVTVADANTFQFSTTEAGAVFTVTASGSNAFYGYPSRQLFNMVAAGEGWTVAAGAAGVSTSGPSNDAQSLTFATGCPANQKSFIKSLGASGIDLSTACRGAAAKYLSLDIVLKYVLEDPTTAIVARGPFLDTIYRRILGVETATPTMVTKEVYASGFELALYSDVGCTVEIARYAIPGITTDGKVNRIMFHLGTLSGTVIRGLAILTASYFVAPTGGSATYDLWLYSEAWNEEWSHQGNHLLPAAVNDESPWYDLLPPDPGALTAGTAQPTSAVILETFPQAADSYDDFTPDHPRVRFRYCFRGQDSESLTYYHTMISNPSAETSAYMHDAWRYFYIILPGYILPENAAGDDVFDEYGGSYVDSALFYRSIYDGLDDDADTGAVGVWSDYGLFGWDSLVESALSGGAPTGDFVHMAYTGTQASPIPDGYPAVLATNRDYADSARYCAVADARIYAFGLTYDNTNSIWGRPLRGQVSNFADFAAFPTTPSEDYIETDGEELGEFAPQSYEVRALLAKDETKYLFTDNGFYELVGRDAAGGWQFLRRDAIGCNSAKTVADCRSVIIWHNGLDFYAHDGSRSLPISQGILDPSLFDFTRSHGATYWRDRYVFFAYYNDPDRSTPWCLFLYDPRFGSWRRRHNLSYGFAGIAADSSGENVYALTNRGEVVNVFGGTPDYGGDTIYTIDTRYMEWPDGGEHHTDHLLLEVITDQTSDTLEFDFYSQGRLNMSDLAKSLTIGSARTKYGAGDLAVNLIGDAVRIVMRYTGTHPPEIHLLALESDDTPEEA